MAGIPGIIHIYHPKRTLPLFVYSADNSNSSSNGSNNDNASSKEQGEEDSNRGKNVLLFIGGMFDSLTATPYVKTLADYLNSGSKWTVIHPLLSSSARQFGISSLDRDVEEIASAIEYIRSTPSLGTTTSSRIVLMGHSTGCQDVMHYITTATTPKRPRPQPQPRPGPRPRPSIQGAILQAPVSDREGMLDTISTSAGARAAAEECNAMAASTPISEHAFTLLPFQLTRPFYGSVPLTISRWLSLISPSSPDQPGADDKFSSDLSPAVLAGIFGRLAHDASPLQPLPSSFLPGSSTVLDQSPRPPSSLLVLMSGDDEFVTVGVDQAVLLDRWKRVVNDATSSSSTTGGSAAGASAGAGAGAGAAAEINPASGVIAGAKHNLAGDLFAQRWAREVDLPERVLTYLDQVVGGRSVTNINNNNSSQGVGVGKQAWELWRHHKQALELERKRETSGVGPATSKI